MYNQNLLDIRLALVTFSTIAYIVLENTPYNFELLTVALYRHRRELKSARAWQMSKTLRGTIVMSKRRMLEIWSFR